MSTDKGTGTAPSNLVGTTTAHNNNNSNSSSSSNGGGGAVVVSISSKPTLITHGKLRFLIMDAPRQTNLHLYIRECRRQRVTDIVRVCEPTYHGAELATAGIILHEMAYDDGRIPPPSVLDAWLNLVEERFFCATTTSIHNIKGELLCFITKIVYRG